MASEQLSLIAEDHPSLASILALDDSVIPKGSEAAAGFRWGEQTGEVFRDDSVNFHHETEVEVPGYIDGSTLAIMSDQQIIEMIKKAHGIKSGVIPEEQ